MFDRESTVPERPTDQPDRHLSWLGQWAARAVARKRARSLAEALVPIAGTQAEKGKTVNNPVDTRTFPSNLASAVKREFFAAVEAMPIVILVNAIRADSKAREPDSTATSMVRARPSN